MKTARISICVMFIILVSSSVTFAVGETLKLTSGGLSEITVAPGTVVTVDMSVDRAVKGGKYIDFLADPGLNIASVGAWIPILQTAGGPGSLIGGNILDALSNQTGGTTDTPANTVLYSFNVTANASGQVSPYMSATDAFFMTPSPGYFQVSTLSPLTINIPGPMTFVLLGLGGLLLRCRK